MPHHIEVDVEEIPLPWPHIFQHTVVALEYPEDRPLVVDLVFEDGTRTAETRHSGYKYSKMYRSWDIARFVKG